MMAQVAAARKAEEAERLRIEEENQR